ncbi:MAG TPA: acyltransferase family protein [Acidobacteriaceae bacterium]|nr:acyltransferase family protein [Acidobacteriaceae bacterium]HUO14478.1 acyltransferase family protein [Verrucomicrobiae bacterium]
MAVMGSVNPRQPADAVEPSSARSAKSVRNPALDFTKGALVLIMVLYHWFNYFYSAQEDVYKYLRFLTPSFIFITGFLISNIYLGKYSVSDSRLPRRLAQRGFKILGVFLALNVVRAVLLSRGSRDQLLSEYASLQGLTRMYVTGTNLGGGQTKAMAFYVLLPIAYLLMLSALLLLVARFYRHTFYVSCGAMLLFALALDAYGVSSTNLELVAIGLLGVVCGYAPIQRVNGLVRHPFMLSGLYAAYLYSITVWNVVYPLQIVGVLLSLMIIYLIGSAGNEKRRVRAITILLGKYSLLGYIAQIAVLQVLRRGLSVAGLSSQIAMVVSFPTAVALTIGVVAASDWARRGSGRADRLYRAVFA